MGVLTSPEEMRKFNEKMANWKAPDTLVEKI